MDHNPQGTRRPTQLSGPLENHFIKLREDKAPISWDTYEGTDLNGFNNVGVMIPEPYVVIDIDEADHAERLTRLIKSTGLKCQIMQTTRGRHFWFTSAEPVKNSVKTMTGIGLFADYRSWGKSSQVCVKLRGEWRVWLTDNDWGDLDELPRWLRPLRQNKWKFYDMGDGDGRNQALYEYQTMLSAREYTYEEAAEAIRLINNFILREPLPERELRLVSREEAYPEPAGKPVAPEYDEGVPWIGERGKFLHNVMGDILIAGMNIVSLHKQLYTYRGGCYRPGENDILKTMIELFPTCTRTNQNEVINYITIQQHLEDPPLDEYVINCKNGRLDLRTGELAPHSPEAIDFQQINAAFDPTCYYEPLDATVMRIFCGDWQLYKLFEEMMGYSLIKNSRMRKLFIFFGEGKNGKSTLLRLITSFIGEGNYSSISLHDLETTFRPAELQNKLVNLGDDIPATDIRDSSFLKSISSGERVTVERKNKDPFILKNYATMIFTTNKMPRVNDKSFGFYDRLVLIPLDARFTEQGPDWDPDIAQKLETPEAMSYLLNMAVRGLRRLLKQGFTRVDKVDKAIEAYKIQSSTTLLWLIENGLDEEYLLSKHTGELYLEFRHWCDKEGVENIPKQQTFTADIKKRFEFDLKQVREEKTGARNRYFSRVTA